MSHSIQRARFVAEFNCLGADCEDTCCKGWGMQVDASTEKLWRDTDPTLITAVTGQPGHRTMVRDAATDYCIKFEDGLCGIQKPRGDRYLSDACHFYPRALRGFGDTILVTAALSCPEIARLALTRGASFALEAGEMERIPGTLPDYKPVELTTDEAISVHTAFLNAALDETAAPARALMRIASVTESLTKLSVKSWPEAVPFYLTQAESRLLPPEPHPTDPAYLLQALCGLVAAAKKANQPRLMETIARMESALHLSIRWDNLAIAPLPDSMHATQNVWDGWKTWEAELAPVMRRYLAAQLSLALFPYGGFGGTLTERIAIIGVRFATVRLALLCARSLSAGPMPEDLIVRTVQSLSRFLDHLADPEFSVKIYQETGWLQPRRLRALAGDTI